MIEIARRLAVSQDGLAGQRIIVQQPAAGRYCVVQAVFQHGRLVAAHCYTLRARGVGGSAHARESVTHPQVVEHASVLGEALAWHGALHMEYFFRLGRRPACSTSKPTLASARR